MIDAYLCEFTQRLYLTYIYAFVNFIFHILYSGILGGTFSITNNLSDMFDERLVQSYMGQEGEGDGVLGGTLLRVI